MSGIDCMYKHVRMFILICMCLDATVTFRRQTATAAWGRPRPRQRDHEGGALPDTGKVYGADARRVEDDGSERQPRNRCQIHSAAVVRGGRLTKMPSEPRVRRIARPTRLPPSWSLCQGPGRPHAAVAVCRRNVTVASEHIHNQDKHSDVLLRIVNSDRLSCSIFPFYYSLFSSASVFTP